jgi:hypothetical protein
VQDDNGRKKRKIVQGNMKMLAISEQTLAPRGLAWKSKCGDGPHVMFSSGLHFIHGCHCSSACNEQLNSHEVCKTLTAYCRWLHDLVHHYKCLKLRGQTCPQRRLQSSVEPQTLVPGVCAQARIVKLSSPSYSHHSISATI